MTSTLERLRDKRSRLAELRNVDAQRWWDDPIRFIDDVITFPDNPDGTPGNLADYQADELRQLATRKRVAVRGPRGSGKTMPAALAVWWFACTRELAGVDWKIPTTAGSWDQIRFYLWPEIHKWHRRINWERVGLPQPMKGRELLTHQLKLEHGEAFGRATDDPALIEGAHASNMLVIIDEGKSVVDGIWDAVEGFFSNPGDHYCYALSTPGAATGRFHDICTQATGYDDWYPLHVTIGEAIAAGRITQEWADRRLAQWGKNSVPYQTHVLANFSGEEDGVIPLAWIEQAIERGKSDDSEHTPHRIGVDVSDTGDDQTVFAYINQTGCYLIERITGGDVVSHADKIAVRVTATSEVIIDSIGVGAGTLAQAKKLGLRASGFVASERSTRKDRTGTFGFVNKRAAAWWNLRELLDPDLGDGLSLPDDAELLGDLSAPTWREIAGGKIQIESKADIRKRLGRSTDVGDAVVMGFAPTGRVLDGNLMV